MRGYAVREKVAVILHKHKMGMQLREQEQMFAGFRSYLKESLQIKLAYLFRYRKKMRIRREEEEERQRLEAEAEAKKEALREKRAR